MRPDHPSEPPGPAGPVGPAGVLVARHDHWLPLDLGLGEAGLTLDLRRRFAATTHPALLEFVTARLAALAQELAEAGSHSLWVLLDEGGQLAPAAIAVLRLVEHHGDDVGGLLQAGGVARPGRPGGPTDPAGVETRRVETASGPATALLVSGIDARAADQAPRGHAVCWTRPATGRAAVLSAWATSNEADAGLAPRLEELAAGVSGL